MDDLEDMLPPRPEAPLPLDCCGTGCSPCVHDIYEQDLKAWKKSCKLLKDKNKESCFQEQIISNKRYSDFELIKIQQITHDTFIYEFALANNRSLGLQVGQHLIVRGNYKGKVISRPYTPISDLTAKGMFQLMIKIYLNGKMSSVVSEWNINEIVQMRGPYGSFSYSPNSFKKIIMLAAGTGIAPMFQVIKYIITNEEDFTKIHLMYSSKSFKDILLRDDLLSFQSYWNLTICHYLSREEALKDKKYAENVELRKLAKFDVEEEIKKESLESSLILISGTKSFDKDMMNAALNVDGMPEDHIFKF